MIFETKAFIFYDKIPFVPVHCILQSWINVSITQNCIYTVHIYKTVFLLFSSGIGWCSQLRTETAVIRATNTDRNLNYLDLCPDSPVLLCMARRTEPQEKARVRAAEDHAEGYIRVGHALEHKGTHTNRTHFGRTGGVRQHRYNKLKPCSHSHAHKPTQTSKSFQWQIAYNIVIVRKNEWPKYVFSINK